MHDRGDHRARARRAEGATTDPAERANLSATLGALGEPQAALEWLARMGFGAVQLSASQAGLRPRELDASARRGVRERLRRLELAPSGIDLWIPVEHFAAADTVSRAIDAFAATIAFAEFLGRIGVSCVLPAPESAPEARRSVIEEAARRGVRLADFAEGAKAEGPVGAGVDQSRCRAASRSTVEAIACAGASLAAVRIGSTSADGRSAPIEPGSMAAFELAEIRLAIEVGGAHLTPVADARSWPDPPAGLASTIDAWRRAASTRAAS